MSAPGSLVGSYVVERALSSGGMSDALLARSPAGRLVVLKKPRSYDADLSARLRDEGRLGSRIFHPHLVETLDCFEFQGLPVLVLGFVEGPTVDEMRRAQGGGPLAPAAIARVGCHVAEALGAVHDALGDDGQPLRAVHRDVTARNVVVTPEGEAVLIDLGIARFDELRAARTETGMVIGTLRYIAPEIVDGADPSQASDFYSLGCVLIEAFTAQPVFTGPPSAITARILGQGPLSQEVAAALPAPLRAAIERLVARRPADRFASAHDVSRALRDVEAALGGGQQELAARARAFVNAAATEPIASAPVPAPVGAGESARVGDAGQTSAGGQTAAVAQTATAVAPASFTPAPFAPQVAQPPVQPYQAPAPRSFGPGTFGPPPRVEVPLELAAEPRRQKPVEVLSNPRDHYPTYARDWSWLTGVAKGAGVLLLLAAAAIGWRWYDAGQRAEDQRALEAKIKSDTALLQKALADTPETCGGDGSYWSYTDKRGTPVVVDSLGKIPKQYRKAARCVRPAR